MIYHVSHVDMDGVGCQIISGHIYGDRVKFYNADYDNVDEVLRKILSFITSSDEIFITDISPAANDVIKALDAFDNVCLVDHHKTALEKLGERRWVNITIGKCGTKLVQELLTNNVQLEQFADMVNDYDLWIHADPRSKRFNSLLYTIGMDKFRERFLSDLSLYETKAEAMILDAMEGMKNQYIDSALKKVVYQYDETGTYHAHVCVEKHMGEIATLILNQKPEVQYVFCLNAQQGTVSLRSRKDGFDVSALAKSRGGGGHQPASGYVLGDNALYTLRSVK